jgi:hypothetical protein
MAFVLLLSFLFFSCASPGETAPGEVPSPQGSEGYVFNVTVSNQTLFDIEIIDDARIIPHGEERLISLPVFSGALNDGYQVWYRVNLLEDIFIKLRRPENSIIPDSQRKVLIDSPDFVSPDVYLILANNTNQVISLKSEKGYLNYLVRLEAAKQYGPSVYIEPDKRQLYEIPSGLNTLTVEADQYKTVSFPPFAFRPGFIYSFVYDGVSVAPADARPLRRLGERAWASTVQAAAPLIPLGVHGDTISALAASADGASLYAWNSRGRAETPIRLAGDAFEILSASSLEDGAVLAAGREKAPGGKAAAVLFNQDGTVRGVLAPSGRRDARYGGYLTAARVDERTWLLAGGGREIPYNQYGALLTLVREDNGKLSAAWELSGEDFSEKTPPGQACGEVVSALYDEHRERYLVIGRNIEFDSLKNPVTGSYLAEITRAGRIQTITAFKGILFHKIVMDANGAYYLAGEEERGNESYGVVLKYGAEGGQVWKAAAQPKSHSYYTDAIMNDESGALVLGGTLNAGSESGEGGFPFIEEIDSDTGSLRWREEYREKTVNGTSLVTGIIPAPDYGYALALSGVAGGGYGEPYMLVRVNSRGKMDR